MAGSAPLRVALYSHDGMGLGHMRRNALVAEALARSQGGASVLLVAGAREMNGFRLPDAVDCLTLPGFRKVQNGEYRPRHLDIGRDRLVALRAGVIRTALADFRPDLVIVDKTPLGIHGDLLPALELLRARGTPVVLGLRDILDDPRQVEREWREGGFGEAMEAFYRAAWIYGDPAVYDLLSECGLPAAAAARACYTGYLDPWARACLPTPGRGGGRRPYVLCQVGGGEDGELVATAFVRSTLPPGMEGVVVQGPFLPDGARRRIRGAVRTRSRIRLLDFVPEPMGLVAGARQVVTMGGYNSVCEVLGAGRSALVIPRVRPRMEQWIRAERFRRLDLLDSMHPGELTPDALSEWMHAGDRPRPQVRDRIDFDGVARLPRLARELVPPGPHLCASAALHGGAST